MKPTQERINQFLNHLWDYIQDEDTNSGRLLLDRLLDLIDERIDERLAKPPIPEPGREAAKTKTEDSGNDVNIKPAAPVSQSEFRKDIEDLEISVIEARIPPGPIWDFIVKYRDRVRGRFVPEQEIENLRNDVEWAWNESDFGDAYQAVHDFLQAIEKGGQDA